MNSWYPDYEASEGPTAIASTAIDVPFIEVGQAIAAPLVAPGTALTATTVSAGQRIAVPTIDGPQSVSVPNIAASISVTTPGILGVGAIPVPHIVPHIPESLISVSDILPTTIESAIFERGRAKLQKDYLAQTQVAATEISSRGFALPNGVLASKLDSALFDVHGAVAGLARDIAIKQAETAIDINIKRAELAVGVATEQAHIEERVGIAQADVDVRINIEQAGLGSNTGIRKAELLANIAIEQAKLDVEVGKFEASLASDISVKRAEIASEIGRQQAGIDSTVGLKQAEVDTTISVKNAEIESSHSELQAQLTSSVGMKQAEIDASRSERQADIASSIAMRKAEIDAENMRFSMGLVHQKRTDAINAAIRYVDAVISAALNQGLEKAKLIVQAKQALWNASNEYYRTLIQSSSVLLQYESLLQQRSIEIARIMADVAKSDTDRYTQGAVAGASSMGTVAAAAFSSINTLTNAAHETIAGA